MPPKGSKYPNQARHGLFRNGLSLNDVKMITALYYYIRLVRVLLLMNFTCKVVLTSCAIYTKIFVCMYGFGIKLITSSTTSTNIAFIDKYTLIKYNILWLVWYWLGNNIKINYQYQWYMYHTVCLSVCLFANSFNAKGKCNFFIKNSVSILK